MPFILILAGAVLLIAAVRNTQQSLYYLLALDFTGPHNFVFWVIAIMLIGAIGYIPKLKPLSDGFLILVILVLFLRKGYGFFDMFTKQIHGTETSTPTVNPTGTPVTVSNFGGGSNTAGIVNVGIGAGRGLLNQNNIPFGINL